MPFDIPGWTVGLDLGGLRGELDKLQRTAASR
jgi:hypothetical protein